MDQEEGGVDGVGEGATDGNGDSSADDVAVAAVSAASSSSSSSSPVAAAAGASSTPIPASTSSPTTTTSPTAVAGQVAYAGVNEAGLEFGMTVTGPSSGAVPGALGSNYFAPAAAAVQHTRDKFANVFRLPFMWERLQPALYAGFDQGYLATLQGAVETIKATGAAVILDPHNYARYNGNVVSGADLADLWSRLAALYPNDPLAAAAIRAAGATQNLILVPGTCYTGAHSWTAAGCDSGSANADAAAGFTADNNFAFEMHQYFDADFSGTAADCTQDAAGALASATAWLRAASGRRGFLGELGVADNDACRATLDAALAHLDANSDVWLGYTYWAAGSSWGDYMFSVESDADGTDSAVFNVLVEHPGWA
ncbi:hypothetical protein HK405_011015 [Cladochytrium tenue]|nr:hypothetical protein HK405_011015 [Cladochytrium tenue]